MRARKAFIFTTDAVLAFYLITIILSVLLLLSYTPKLYTQQFQSVARDTVVALSTIRLRDVWGNPQYNYTNSLLFIRYNSILQWPMFERTIEHNTSLVSAYPQSNNTWIVYKVGPPGTTTGIHSTPLEYNGKVIIASENGTYAFDENTGVLLWYLPVRADSTPLIYNGHIILGSLDNILYSLDERGQIVWNITLLSSIVSSPIAHNGKVLLTMTNGSLLGFDIESGLPLSWTFAAIGNITSTPIVYNQEIIIFSHDSTATHLYAIDEDSGAQLWNYSYSPVYISLFIDPSPVVSDGVVYVNNEVNVDALNATTGIGLNNSNWPASLPSLNFTSSPAFDGQVIYIGCLNTSDPSQIGVCAIDTNSSPPTIHPAYVGFPVYSSPIVINNSLVLASIDGIVRVVNKSAIQHWCTCQTIWSYQTGAAIYSSPALVNGRIYIGSDDGNVYSFGNCTIWDDNMSVLDTIAAFWSIGRKECAQSLAKEFLDSAVPQNYGFELVVKSPQSSGLQCVSGLGYSCHDCNGIASTEWDSIYTNDCNQTKYQRFLIQDNRYVSGLLQKGSTIYYTRNPIEVELRIWN